MNLEIEIDTISSASFFIRNNDAEEEELYTNGSIVGNWLYLFLSVDFDNFRQFILFTSFNEDPETEEIAILNDWVLNESLILTLGGESDDFLFFNGQLSRTHLILNYFSNSKD